MPLPDILMVKVSVYMYTYIYIYLDIYIVSFIDTSSFCGYFFLHLLELSSSFSIPLCSKGYRRCAG